MNDSSFSFAALHRDMLRFLFDSESESEEFDLLDEESELLEECLRFFFFLSLPDFEGALLTLLTLELVSFPSSENPGFFLKTDSGLLAM